MTPKFVNTATVRTRESLVLKGGSRRHLSLRVRLGILERPDGLVLIDAGYSTEAISAPNRSWGLRAYAWAFSPELLEDGDPVTALARLGYTPGDVSAVIVTHFHVDHVSALGRFPGARLIAHGPTFAGVTRRGTFSNLRRGIFPELLPADMRHRLDDVTARPEREAPHGLGPGWDLFGDGSVLAIDLPGHAEGHFGLCFPLAATPLLYATDVQWLRAALPNRGPGFPASLIAEDRRAAQDSISRVARFAAAGGEVMLCHDPEPTAHDLGTPT